MGFDEFGILWLFDPWVAGVILTAVLGVVLWSHGWIVTGAPPRPHQMAVRLRRDADLRRAQLRRAIQLRRASLAGAERGPVPVARPATSATIVHLEHRRRPRSAA